jgi:hypothetical protein
VCGSGLGCASPLAAHPERHENSHSLWYIKRGRVNFPKLEQVLTQLRSEKFDLRSLGYPDAELLALLAPPKDFDWAAFNKYRGSLAQSTYVLLPVKVSIARKDQLKAAIRKRAAELGIAGGDPAVAAGEVVAHLLGVTH